jgi:hypothetical protein
LPRRGRTTITGSINGHPFTALLELAAGNKRVCCFDNSGFYSKAFSAPQAAVEQE